MQQFETTSLHLCFSHLNGHRNLLGILLKCGFKLGRSGLGPEVLTFLTNSSPDGSAGAGVEGKGVHS